MLGNHFSNSLKSTDHCGVNSFSLAKAKRSGLAFKVFSEPLNHGKFLLNKIDHIDALHAKSMESIVGRGLLFYGGATCSAVSV